MPGLPPTAVLVCTNSAGYGAFHVILPDFETGRVLVVGDVMLDRYWRGDSSRISPEAPVPVVCVQGLEEKPGGAANVALNVAALGCKASLLGVTGDDAAGKALQRMLAAAGVVHRLQRVSGRRTIVKLRVLSRNQQLVRLDFEDTLEDRAPDNLPEWIDDWVDQVDVVIFSDYGKGTLGEIQRWVARARATGKVVLVDPKGRDLERYRGATLMTPNLAEFEDVVGRIDGDFALASRAESLRRDLGLQAMVVTRGKDGMTVVEEGRDAVHLAARAREVYDVTGAGDTVIAVLAAALASGADVVQAARIANEAAGIVVGKLGAVPVTRGEIEAQATRAEASPRGVLTEAALLRVVAESRAKGERVVMTNGCFDLLHPGHVRTLQQAKRLGDRLVVAINDDESVRRLKGSGRPVNPLWQRMETVAALAAVDWLVPFSEDTPERVICKVLPDVLVKGGDYRGREVAGTPCVTASGGRVVILDQVPACSTSDIISRIRDRR